MVDTFCSWNVFFFLNKHRSWFDKLEAFLLQTIFLSFVILSYVKLENLYYSIFWLYFINAQLGYKLEKLVNKPAIQSMTAQVIWERISLITIFFHARLFAIFISHKKRL